MTHNQQGKLWLIGGTSESRELARVLRDRAVPWIATVTTERARQLYDPPNLPASNPPIANPLTSDPPIANPPIANPLTSDPPIANPPIANPPTSDPLTANLPIADRFSDRATRSPSPPAAPFDHSSPLHAVRVGALTPEDAQHFVIAEKICGILDASHPFAVDISQMAIAIAKAQNLPYLRFERASLTTLIDINPVKLPAPQVIKKVQFMDLFEPNFFKIYLANQRILLTTGVKSLSFFPAYLNQAEFWARILPTEASRQQAIAVGFPEERLILQQLPVTFADELSLCERLNIQVLITKASGDRGGVNIKFQVAQQLNLKLVLIERPPVNYPLVTDDLDQAIGWAINITPNIAPNIAPNITPNIAPNITPNIAPIREIKKNSW